MMMKKNIFYFAAMASLMLASCTSDELAGSSPTNNVKNDGTPIMFSSMNKGFTRADFVGSDAAAKLGNKFVVSAKKGSTTAATDGVVTFDNYVVEYAENTAHTTASNVANWEYVGKGRIKPAIDNGITSQTIKYWDYSADQYDFIAWSTGSKEAIYEGTPSSGQVLVSAINPNATATAAVTFKGAAKDLQECYISNITTVKKDQYGPNPVTMQFRSLGSKVRIAIYETVPGYSVKNVKFYTAASSGLAGDATDYTPRLFSTAANNIYTNGTYTVTYPTVDGTDPDNNVAHVSFAGDGAQSTIVDFGALNLTNAEEGERTTGKVFLGRSSATASFAGEAEGNYYTAYLPNEAGTNLNLRVNFTLEAIDGGAETIEVKGATAQVPSIYTQWKAGYAYTYIFKISDKTNGYTGAYDPTKPDDTTVNSDPAGLYPITFDAVVVNAEDNDKTQETITTISTPSFTTYQKGSNVLNNDEYLAATGPIFVTVNDGTTASTPDLANGALQDLTGKAALYTIPLNKTEAEVIDALQMQDDDAASGTIKGRSGLVLTPAAFELTDKIEYGVDGNIIDLTDGEKKKAAKFTAVAGTYVFVYTKQAPTAANNKEMYEALNFESFADGQTKYRYDYKTPTTADAQKGVKYFAVSGGVYTLQAPFIGQGVGNLYTRSGAGTPESPYVYTVASGYAVTGTTYYYTLDKGATYRAAHNVAYADFAGATDLYTFNGSTYTAKAETIPADDTAYYQRTGTGSATDPYVYTYCVILPQQTTGWQELDTTKYAVANETSAVAGQTYFDKYVQNDGVYYAKVIKVQ